MKHTKTKLLAAIIASLLATSITAKEVINVDWFTSYQNEYKGVAKEHASFLIKGNEQIRVITTNQHYKSRDIPSTVECQHFDVNGLLKKSETIEELAEHRNYNTIELTNESVAITAISKRDSTPILVIFDKTYSVREVITYPNRRGYEIIFAKESRDAGSLFIVWSKSGENILEKISLSTGGWEYPISNSITGISLNPSGEVVLLSKVVIDTVTLTDYEYINYDAEVQLLDKSGKEVWSYVIGGSNSEEALAVTTTKAGAVIVTGESHLFFNSHYSSISNLFIAKITPTGDLEWMKEYNNGSRNFGEKVQVDDSGNIAIIGISNYRAVYHRPSNFNSWVLLTDKEGDTTVTHTIMGRHNKVSFSNNKHFSVKFDSTDFYEIYDRTFTAIDTITIASLDEYYGKSNLISDGVLYQDRIISVGEALSFGGGKGDILISVTDLDGNLLVQKSYGDSGTQKATNVFKSGNTLTVVGKWNNNLWMATIDRNGDTLWSKTIKDTMTIVSSCATKDGIAVLGTTHEDDEYLWNDSTAKGHLILINNRGEVTSRYSLTAPTGVRALGFTPYYFGEKEELAGYIIASEENYPAKEVTLTYLDASVNEVRKVAQTHDDINTIAYKNGRVYLGGDNHIYSEDTLGGDQKSYYVTSIVRSIVPLDNGEVVFNGANGQQNHNGNKRSFGKLSVEGVVNSYSYTSLAEKIVPLSNSEFYLVGDISHITGYTYPYPGKPQAHYSERYPAVAKLSFAQVTSVAKISLVASKATQKIVGENLIISLGKDDMAGELVIYSVAGRALIQAKLSAKSVNNISLQGLSAGLYISQIQLYGGRSIPPIKFIR